MVTNIKDNSGDIQRIKKQKIVKTEKVKDLQVELFVRDKYP